MVAELAKTQCHVKHQHAPGKSQQAVDTPKQPMNGKGQHDGAQRRERPSQPTMLRAARIQVAARPTGPGAQTRVNEIASGEWPGLLKQQGKQDSKKAHSKS